MNQWLNTSHPQTLVAAVILGYFSAVFGVLQSGASIFLLLFLGVGAGAFGSANNKRWGYYLLAGCAFLIALFWTVLVIDSLGARSATTTLQLLNGAVFPVALAVAVLHRHSREYQKVWFE